MFVVVTTYRAKQGEEDSIIALHEDRAHDYKFKADRYYSWVLLRKIDEPGKFISIAHFVNQRQARAATKDLERDGWLGRLMSLMDGMPTYSDYKIVWSLN